MVAHKPVVFLVVLVVLWIISGVLYADRELTPEQLVLLMKASRERYNTFDAKIKVTNYKHVNDKSEIVLTSDIVSRWTKSRRFSRIVRTVHQDEVQHKDFTPTTVKTYAITPNWSKRLIEAPDNRTPRGYVKGGMAWEKDQGFYGIHDAMWRPFGYPLERISTEDAVIELDEDKGYYILKAKIGNDTTSPVLTLYVDSSKTFIPVHMEYAKHDGTLVARCESSDLRQTADGLWIPYKYCWKDPRRNLEIIYEVKDVKVNEPVPDHLLDFSFPSGTVVFDEISNLRYRVDDEEIALDAVINDRVSKVTTDTNETRLLRSGDIVVAPPAKENDLIASASKAEELLTAHSKHQRSYGIIYLLTIPVLLAIVGSVIGYRFLLSKKKPGN